ncbi:MAG: YncE family protein, partial [Pirellulaceae bacterium]
MVRSFSIFCVLVLLGFTCTGHLPLQDETPSPNEDELRKRRPCKVLLTPDGDRLLVANRFSGTISLIDTASLELVGEGKVADELTDLVHWKEQYYLTSDFANGQLVCVRVDGSEISVVSRIPTISFPQVLQLNRESSDLLVGGLWSRRICRHSLPVDPQQDFGINAVRDVPFCVAHLCPLPFNGVLTGDAFGDRWLVLETDDLK